MRILYLCHRIPYPPNKGEKIRAFHQLRAMAERHEVDVFTLVDREADAKHKSQLAQYCRSVTVARLVPATARLRALPYLFRRTPLTLPYFYSRDLSRQIRKALRERSYDRIFVYSSSMAQYVDLPGEVPVLADLVDVDSDKWFQYAAHSKFPWSALYRREGRCLRDYERRICESASCVLVTTEREAQLLRSFCSSANVRVVPNGVDTDYFDPSHMKSVSDVSNVPAVIFTGAMDYFPNVNAVAFFARQVLPLIRKSLPETRFLIVGSNPAAEVKRLEKIPGVEVTGYVPDIRSHLSQAHVFVAPLSIAAGIQNKILEAMAMELPVVASKLAVQGLSESVAAMVETAAQPEEFADEVVRLLQDPELRRAKGIDSRQAVVKGYSWSDSLTALVRLLENPGERETMEPAAIPVMASR